ncbi:helix-turn-helix transcriptional regulator [Pedobacter sp.]|uniref:helix-turn-helix transcriptional regulator n=2 Tax=Pedobacter sp. TaxID=1411316 RepID=UPI003BAD7D1B
MILYISNLSIITFAVMNSKRIHYNRIKSVLVDKKKSSKVLAEHLKTTPQTVSNWCTNLRQPSIPQLFTIAKFLNVRIMDLLVEDAEITAGAA